MVRTPSHGGPEWRALPPAAAPERQPAPRRAAHKAADGGLDWREPPPKKGRTAPEREDEISAGLRIRKMIEADRRARGIPAEGTLYAGEVAEIRRKPKP